MIGGGNTDKDKVLDKETVRGYNGHRGTIGRARERDGQRETKVKVVDNVCFMPAVS